MFPGQDMMGEEEESEKFRRGGEAEASSLVVKITADKEDHHYYNSSNNTALQTVQLIQNALTTIKPVWEELTLQSPCAQCLLSPTNYKIKGEDTEAWLPRSIQLYTFDVTP